uniref:Early endosome antigen 1 n=1 Tax=Varanus komodoensis TaxID=61221 RepID=A0A8D2LPY5_VARKO
MNTGFICPLCMKSHGSAEELFKHYEAVHDSGIDTSHGGESNMSPNRYDITLLRQEVQDLQASLKEERWYSEELKKELEKVQGQRQQESKPDGLATSASTELESLEHQLEESQLEKFNIKQMKDLFEQKAAQLATEIVDLKAKHDEETSLREAAEQKVANLTQEIQKERGVCKDLKTELLQRPGVEDVAVLKKELVQVQMLMDEMTLERERESEKLKDECNHLRAECSTSEATINQLRAELAKGPQEVAVYVQDLQKLQTSVNELTQKNQSLAEKLKKRELDYTRLEERQGEELLSKKNLQATLNQKDLDCQQLQARLSASEDSLQRLQKELLERGEASQKLKEELSEAETKYQHLKAEFKQLQQQREEKEQHSLQLQNELNQLHNKLLETERQLGEAHGRLKEQRQLSSEKLMDKEQQVADLQLKLSRAEEQVVNVFPPPPILTNHKNDLEQVLRQIGDKDQKIQNLEALLQKSKENISLLEKEREDLYAKIQAGEGETAVLNQLQEKNHTLQEQVTQLMEKLKNQSESHKQALENLHEQVQEQKAHLRASQDRVLSLETTISELNSQLSESKEKAVQLDLQVKAKTELLLSAEAAKAAQRADLQNHLDTAQNALQDKQQELNKVSTQLDQVTAKLHEKQEYCMQLETSLKEYKEKQLHLEQKTEELEGNQKKLEADITEAVGIKEKTLQELQQQRQQCTDLSLKAAELIKQLDVEREIISSTKLDLQKKCDSLEEANQQLLKQEEENARLKLDIEKIHQDADIQHKELNGKLEAVTEDLKKMKSEKDTLLKELEVIKDKLAKSTESLKEANDELEKEKHKGKAAVAEIVSHISKQLAIELDSARAQVQQMQGVLKEKEKNEQQLQLKVKELKESFDQKKKQNEIQQAELKTALLEKAELENKLQQQITLSAQELTTEREKITELQKAHKKTQENMEKLQLDFYGKESELLATRQDLKSIEEKLALAQEELVSNRNQITNHNQLIKELKTLRSTLEQDLSKKGQQLKEQEKLLQEIQKDKVIDEKDLANEKSKTTELQNINSKQEKENSKLKEEARICKQEYEKLTNLKDAKELLIKQKLELQGKVDTINTALEQEKRNQEVIKDQLKKREDELKKKCAEMEAKLVSEIKEKEEQYKDHKDAEDKLSMQITALNENLGTVKKEWQSSQRRVSELEKQTDDLRGEIAVLEATVQNNQDERRMLLERCLKSEGEIEKLQSKLMDARRKLDDTTAAMQELGRENQSLQIKHTQALNRKWAEDNEVQNCMACGKGFSVTVRRHHCRQCGNIFCAECSSKNALTPSSKKPVRVCDTCFNDLQG